MYRTVVLPPVILLVVLPPGYMSHPQMGAKKHTYTHILFHTGPRTRTLTYSLHTQDADMTAYFDNLQHDTQLEVRRVERERRK